MILKKKSFVVVLLIAFWLGYMLLSIVQTTFTTIQAKARIDDLRNQNIDFILNNSKDFILSENFDLLREQLQNAVKLKFIDYYCFKDGEKVLQEMYLDTNRSACKILDTYNFIHFDQFHVFDLRTVKPIKIDNYILIVGYSSNLIHFLKWEHKENLIPFIKDVFIITIFVGLLIFLILKDFVIIEQLLQSGNKEKLARLKTSSKEAQTLLDSTRMLDKINLHSRQSIHLLQNTVGEALASEIRKKTPSLTSLQVSVVRIDLNGYTQIFLEKKEEHIVSILNEYFEVTNDIINRYHGEIYQIIGDEVIFIFKGHKSDPLVPELKALFAVKSIFEWAKKLDKKVNDQFGHRFLLKSSISNGNLKFVKLNTGFAFAGVPLIESVRLLGCVSDKSENSLVVLEASYHHWDNFFQGVNRKMVQLKGFEETVPVVEIKEFVSLDAYFVNVLREEDREIFRYKMNYLDYFRSQNDILESLVLIDKYFQAEKMEPIFYLLQSLKKISVSVPDALICQRLYQILSDHFEVIQRKQTENLFLSGILNLIPHFINKEMWSDSWSSLLQNYLLSSNPRIVANASEVYFIFHEQISEVKNILINWKDNNRISANLVLAQLKKELAKKETETVIQWIKSGTPLFQASALYLIEELISHYYKKDEVVYTTNDFLAKLKQEGLKLLGHQNEMVRLRASILEKTILEKKNKASNQEDFES
ncbi:MAG: adenylate/guanylate cyclase domain-containing protein [Deltaproteobacteria bacterium]|nr:adenylate/guanylate cyclase domain-containing protein [Deltaproteobacteria bacterium]